MASKHYDRFVESLSGMTQEEKEQSSREQLEAAKKEYEEFKQSLDKGICYICHKPMRKFKPDSVCLHWLTLPKSIKKNSFGTIFDTYGFQQILTYIKWLANHEAPLVNINNLADEKGTKLLEQTITYQNIEWAFSIGESDLKGEHGGGPHYHFQLRREGNVFWKFNDKHIPLSDYDKVVVELMVDPPEGYAESNLFSAGPQDIMDTLGAEKIVVNSRSGGDDDSKAPFHLSTIIQADENGLISGDKIADLIEESKRSGRTMADLAKEEFSNSTTIVSPSENIPEMKNRSGRNKKKKN